jgi:hypothetical protein
MTDLYEGLELALRDAQSQLELAHEYAEAIGDPKLRDVVAGVVQSDKLIQSSITATRGRLAEVTP